MMESAAVLGSATGTEIAELIGAAGLELANCPAEHSKSAIRSTAVMTVGSRCMPQTICGLSWKPHGGSTLWFIECCPICHAVSTTPEARAPRSAGPWLGVMVGHGLVSPAEARSLPQPCLVRSRRLGLPRQPTRHRQHRQRHSRQHLRQDYRQHLRPRLWCHHRLRHQVRPPTPRIPSPAPRPLKLSSRNALPVRATRGGAGSHSLHRRHRPCVMKRGFALLLIDLYLPVWKRLVFHTHRKLRAKR